MISIIIVLLCMCTVKSEASHARGVTAGRAGDHITAQHCLEQALITQPHDSLLLYDAGVAAFKSGNHERAAYYFEQAAERGDASLQQEALFNAGNAYAHTKEYDKALARYEQVLGRDASTRKRSIIMSK